jgi:hypothetical protein
LRQLLRTFYYNYQHKTLYDVHHCKFFTSHFLNIFVPRWPLATRFSSNQTRVWNFLWKMRWPWLHALWPPRLPDFTQVGFSLWHFVKAVPPVLKNIEAQMTLITWAIQQLEDVLTSIWTQLEYWWNISCVTKADTQSTCLVFSKTRDVTSLKL